MLQDSVGGRPTSAYYGQGFGTPGNVSNIGLVGQQQQPQATGGRTRPRAVSNIGMQGNGSQASGIAQWQSNVQASQTTSPISPTDQRSYGGYVNPSLQQSQYVAADGTGYVAANPPQQSNYVIADGPMDPGPRPSVKGLGLSKQEKKSILDDWQRKADKYEAFKASTQKDSHKRSKSQTRFNDGQYVSAAGGGTMAFPKSQPSGGGYGSNPPSDIERAMGRLGLGGLRPGGNDAAAQRQAERGRRLSGGALGLSGSTAAQQLQLLQQQQQQQQQEQQRAMRERSRSRQPYDETTGGIRPAYMPAGRGGNIANVDSGHVDVGQPGVYPTGGSGYVNAGGPTREDMARMAGGGLTRDDMARMAGGGGGGGGGGYVSAQANVPGNVPYGYQVSPQQPQVSPMFPQLQPQVSPMFPQQQLPIQATAGQMNAGQFVPVTTVGGIQTMGVPIGHVSQLQGFPPVGISPINPTMDLSSNPYLTPAFINQQMPPAEQQQTRRKTNIADVMVSQQQQQQQQYMNPNAYINPKTILTPAPPPKQLHTSNIGNIANASQQPGVQTRARALSQANPGYVPSGAPAIQSQPHVTGDNRQAGYVSGSNSEAENHNTSWFSKRPGMPHSDTLSTTGPQGFGSRPTHTREPSYKTHIKSASHASQPESQGSRSGVPVVSMRPPNRDMRPQHFSPKVISFDLNGEHRQEQPLRFGKFIFERDVTHEEWSLFTQQILDTWAERNPAFNYYHSAVKRIDAILSAWNFAFFQPRGMDVVLFKGNERRSGPRFGEPEPAIEFQSEASPPSDDEEESSEESDDDDENPAHYLASMNPQYRTQIEKEKAMRRARRAEEKRREAASRPLEAPHALVVYELSAPNESYR
ncbi:hypothetical protein M408DRAFT_328789 [Serendipita vermifera MAFF 305830]|uniref:Uncharacterized protein n=1 Tax=Serendipita vermifera MAFF 305830 TaxID=933852 RepID=A0A0C3BBR6_SERVB|nr:hypothetical protein M408DRAFT_328789 [Serendipita vermifera MAFF 305830]